MGSNDALNKGILSKQFLLICFGFFQVCFSSTLIYELFQDRLREYKNTANTLQPWLLTLGSIIGGLMLSFGRRFCSLILDVPIMFAGIITLFMEPYCLFIARIMNDLLRGSALVIYLIYFKEMMPKRYVGITVGLIIFVMAFFLWVHDLIELICVQQKINLNENVPSSTFISRALTFVGILGCQAHFLLSMLFLQSETPRFLIESQKAEEAYAILSLIYKSKESAKTEVSFYEGINEYRQFSKVTWLSLFSSGNRKAFLICCALMLFRSTTGFFSYWSFIGTSALTENGELLIIYTFQCVGSVLVGLFFDKIDHRLLVIIGFSTNLIANSAALLLQEIQITGAPLPLIFAAISSIASYVTIMPIAFLFTVQLLSDKGISLATTCLWISMYVILIPYSSSLHKNYVYMESIYIVASILGVVFSWFFIEKLKGTDEKKLKKKYLKDETY